jgi:hypothetical protein
MRIENFGWLLRGFKELLSADSHTPALVPWDRCKCPPIVAWIWLSRLSNKSWTSLKSILSQEKNANPLLGIGILISFSLIPSAVYP